MRLAGAAARVLELPFSTIRPEASRHLPRPLAWILDWRERFLATLDGWGVVLFAAVTLATFRASPKRGILLLFVVAFLGGYPSIQFQQRHFFHLELLSLCIFGIALSHVWSVVVRRVSGDAATPVTAAVSGGNALGRPAAILLVVAGTLAGIAVGLRGYQQRRVSGLFDRYLAAPLTKTEGRSETVDGRVVRVRGDRLLPEPGARTVASHMLVVALAAEPCGFRRVALTFQYASKAVAGEFSRTLDVDLPTGTQPTRVFFPVFETGSVVPDDARLAFAGLDVPASEAGCVLSVARFERPDAFPLLITAVVRPAFRRETLYQRLRGWEVSSEAP